MSTQLRFTTADLEGLPNIDGVRYEIIDGELYVSKATDWHHQHTSGETYAALRDWSLRTGAGVAILAPGIVFADDDNVIPDLVWISRERFSQIWDDAGHMRAGPDLAVEVLSLGAENERRDRDVKLKLYSRRGVQEYWIVDWRLRTVQVYRREQAVLRLVATLLDDDTLTSPLLPGFTCPIADLWEPRFIRP
jgi:Uma2 family endonuclease